MHEIVKYFILTEIRSEIDRRTLDPLKLIECGAGYTNYYRSIYYNYTTLRYYYSYLDLN